jgi:hypothetical protein
LLALGGKKTNVVTQERPVMASRVDMSEFFEHISQMSNYLKLSVREGMKEITESCARLWPGQPWDRVMALDFEGDFAVLCGWLEKTLSEEPPGGDIEAFWFGLARDEEGKTLRLYISGSDEYDPADEFGDWAYKPAYQPEGRCAPSRVLPAITDIVVAMNEREEVAKSAESALCLGYAALALAGLLRTLPKPLLLNSGRVRYAAVGWTRATSLC